MSQQNCGILDPRVYGPQPTRTSPLLDGVHTVMTARQYTEKDMSDKELEQELDRLKDEKDRRDTLRYFINALEEVLGEREDINGLRSLLIAGASENQIQLLKDFVQSVTLPETKIMSGSEL